MKITKSYLKQIIKEELEQEGFKQWLDKPTDSRESIYTNQSDDSDYRSHEETNRDVLDQIAGSMGMAAVITSPLLYKMFSDLLANGGAEAVKQAFEHLGRAVGLQESKRK